MSFDMAQPSLSAADPCAYALMRQTFLGSQPRASALPSLAEGIPPPSANDANAAVLYPTARPCPSGGRFSGCMGRPAAPPTISPLVAGPASHVTMALPFPLPGEPLQR